MVQKIGGKFFWNVGDRADWEGWEERGFRHLLSPKLTHGATAWGYEGMEGASEIGEAKPGTVSGFLSGG